MQLMDPLLPPFPPVHGYFGFWGNDFWLTVRAVGVLKNADFLMGAVLGPKGFPFASTTGVSWLLK